MVYVTSTSTDVGYGSSNTWGLLVFIFLIAFFWIAICAYQQPVYRYVMAPPTATGAAEETTVTVAQPEKKPGEVGARMRI